MKLTSQEEYGLRCLLRVSLLVGEDADLTIPQIAEDEGLSTFYVAKLMRILRQGSFVKSTRGQVGGYRLARPANQILVSQVLRMLGENLYEPGFCMEFAGKELTCKNSLDCSLRTLWRAVQLVVNQVLSKVTLEDLGKYSELDMASHVSRLVKLSEDQSTALQNEVLGIHE